MKSIGCNRVGLRKNSAAKSRVDRSPHIMMRRLTGLPVTIKLSASRVGSWLDSVFMNNLAVPVVMVILSRPQPFGFSVP
jgi:hypothetical protein